MRAKQQPCGKFLHRPLLQKKLWATSFPLQKYFNYVDTSRNIGRGTMPDYPINITIVDILNGEDKELKTAVGLIKNNLK